jgi:uncharacterized membrane protein YesL
MSVALKKERRKINILFGIFLVVYWIRTVNCVLAIATPEKDTLICQLEVKITVQAYCRYFYIYSVILSMLVYQHITFSR